MQLVAGDEERVDREVGVELVGEADPDLVGAAEQRLLEDVDHLSEVHSEVVQRSLGLVDGVDGHGGGGQQLRRGW